MEGGGDCTEQRNSRKKKGGILRKPKCRNLRGVKDTLGLEFISSN